jgi:hypothetical protein
MTDEEARIIDAQRRIQENILRVRLDIAQNTEGTYSDTVLNLKLANLEQEATITNRKLLDLQAQRLAIEEAYEMERNANIRASEERNRAEIQKTYDENVKLLQSMIEASRQRREQALAADPSSPLSIFGAQGQEAADKGAGIFGQISASASEAISSVSDQLGNFSSMMTDALNAVAGGLQNIIANFIITGRIGGAAFKALAAQIISAERGEVLRHCGGSCGSGLSRTRGHRRRWWRRQWHDVPRAGSSIRICSDGTRRETGHRAAGNHHPSRD